MDRSTSPTFWYLCVYNNPDYRQLLVDHRAFGLWNCYLEKVRDSNKSIININQFLTIPVPTNRTEVLTISTADLRDISVQTRRLCF